MGHYRDQISFELADPTSLMAKKLDLEGGSLDFALDTSSAVWPEGPTHPNDGNWLSLCSCAIPGGIDMARFYVHCLCQFSSRL